MAQTKTKRSSGTKRRSPAKKPAAKAKSTNSRSKAAAAKSKAVKVEQAAKAKVESAIPSVNGHAGKAKIPLLAGGAVLVGTVGGVLLGASNSGRKVLGVSLPRPKRMQVKLKSGDLANAAKEVGRFGENVGDLAAELKRAREGLAGDSKHDSPIEVLLRGLATRR